MSISALREGAKKGFATTSLFRAKQHRPYRERGRVNRYFVPSISWYSSGTAGFTWPSGDKLELVLGKHGEPDGSRIGVRQLHGVVTTHAAQTICDVHYRSDVADARWTFRRRDDEVILRGSGEGDDADCVVLGDRAH